MRAMTSPKLEGETVISRAPQVLSRVIDDEAVLLNLGTGTYSGMNEVATRAWELLNEPTSFARLCEQLHAEFDADADTLAADMREFIQALSEAKLIVTAP